MADIVVCAVPIGLFFGRIANFVNGELFGRTASPDLPWAVVFPGGGDVPRHPSQLYEALLEGAVLFLILAVLARRDKIRNIPGFLSGVFLAGYGVFRFAVEYFREPDAHLGFVLGGLSMGQILCIPMIMVGIGLAIWQMRHQKQL